MAWGIFKFGDFKEEMVVVSKGSGGYCVGYSVSDNLMVVGIKFIIPPPSPDLTASAVIRIRRLFFINFQEYLRRGCYPRSDCKWEHNETDCTPVGIEDTRLGG